MKLTKRYVKNNMHYKTNRIIPVERLVLHSVGCPQPNPDVFFKIWNTPTSKYPAQIVVGAKKAYETLPCMTTKGKAVYCWHVGTANGTSIGVEMTEPSTIKYTGGANWTDLDPAKTKAHVMATYKNAVDIFAQLCKFHDLNPLEDGVILSHSECHARGIGTNHADVEHLWKKFGLSMNQFRKDVYEAMNPDFKVRVSVGCLNMRIGPGTKYARIAFIPKGVYTIVETSGNWGRLKSKQDYKGKPVHAWISLKYTTKL